MTTLMLKGPGGSTLVISYDRGPTIAYEIPRGWEEFILVTLLAVNVYPVEVDQ